MRAGTILALMVSNRRNYYRVLNVQSDAAPSVIKAAYRALISEHHPDAGGDPATAALLNEAYAVLSSAARRVAYDVARAAKDGEHAPFHVRTEPATDASPQPNVTGRRRSGEHARVSSCHMCGFASRGVPATDARCHRCTAPLSAVRISGSGETASDRRAVPRIARINPARLVTDWRRPGVHVQLRDLSTDGLSFCCGDPLRASARVRVACDAFDVVADVVCTRRTPQGVYIIHARMVTAIFAVKAGGFVSALA